MSIIYLTGPGSHAEAREALQSQGHVVLHRRITRSSPLDHKLEMMQFLAQCHKVELIDEWHKDAQACAEAMMAFAFNKEVYDGCGDLICQAELIEAIQNEN